MYVPGACTEKYADLLFWYAALKIKKNLHPTLHYILSSSMFFM